MVTTTDGRGDVGFDARVAGPAEPTVGPTVEGDDIEVLPEPAQPGSRRRVRALIVGAAVVVLAAAAITAGVVSRHHSASGANSLSSVSRVATHTPSRPKSHVAPKHPAVKAHAKPHRSTPTSAAMAPTTAAAVSPASPPAVTPSTAAPVTTPQVESPSVLTWQSAPATLDLKAGAHTTFTVTVSNPTAGTVTLGVPLSCAPTLETAHGAPISNVMCEQMAQVLSPHQTLTQQYTVYATSTGDASGTPLAAGRYIVRVENVYSIPVTVTAS